MLPHIQPEYGGEPLHQGAVLVRAAHHLQLAAPIDHQPGPAAAKTAQRRLGKGLSEGFQPTQIPLDRCGQLAVRLAAALRTHHLPEQAVVGVAAAVIAHRPLNLGRQAVDTGKQCLQRQGSQLRQIGQGGIEVGDISLMVTAVMDLHGLCIDMGFQRVISVRKGWQGMAHVHCLSCWAQCS